MRFPRILICSLGLLQPAFGDEFCSVQKCDDQGKQIKRLKKDAKKLKNQVETLQGDLNDVVKLFEGLDIEGLLSDLNSLKVQVGDVDVKNMRDDVNLVKGRVGGLCDWMEGGDKCYKIRIGDYEIGNYGEDNNDDCLSTSTFGESVSSVCHDKSEQINLFDFTTRVGSGENEENTSFHMNPYDAHVNAYGFEGGSTIDKIGEIQEAFFNICEGYDEDSKSCSSIKVHDHLKIGEKFRIEKYFDECIWIKHGDVVMYEGCANMDGEEYEDIGHVFFLGDKYLEEDGKRFTMYKNSKKVSAVGW